MTMEFVESFSGYTSAANRLRKWDSTSSGSSSVSSPGRYGTGSYMVFQNNPCILTSQQLAARATRVVGFAFNCVVGNTNPIFAFRDGTSTQVDIRINSPARTLFVTRNGTTLGTGTTVLTNSAWYYIEIKATIHASTGSITLKINGVDEIVLINQNTQATANATMDGIQFPNPGYTAWVADIYVLNTLGSVNNDFIGEIHIYGDSATGDGFLSQWTPDSGGTLYTRVNEANPDDDTTYIKDLTVGDIALFSFTAQAITGVVACIQTNYVVKKDDVGNKSVAEVCRSGGTNYLGATQSVLASYIWVREIRETDPNTGLAWTATSIANAQSGVKVIS